MKKYEDLVTIIIPSYKRPHFLNRILNYYKHSQFKILIADSSPDVNKEISNFNCEYYHYPNMPLPFKLSKILQKVKTPYIQFNADDDFCVENSIIQCVKFLESNPQYSTAEGNLIYFDEKKLTSVPGHVIPLSDYNQKDIKDRLIQTLTIKRNTYVNCFYSVHRTKHLLETFEYLDKNGYFNFLEKNPLITPITEFSMLFFAHISGFHKRLPIFHIARSNEPSKENFGAWRDVVGEDYNIFKKIISDYIIKHHKVTSCYAEETFKHVFDFWINYFIEEDQKNQYQSRLIDIVKRFYKKYIFDNTKISEFLRAPISIKNKNKGYPNKLDPQAKQEWNEIKNIIKKTNSY